MAQRASSMVEDSIDPAMFSLFDVGGPVSLCDQDECFDFFDDIITSTDHTETEEVLMDDGDVVSAPTDKASLVQESFAQVFANQQSVANESQEQQFSSIVNSIAQKQLQQLQQQLQPQQVQQSADIGGVIMAMGQPVQPQPTAPLPTGQSNLYQNQPFIHSSLTGEAVGSPLLMKASSGAPMHVASGSAVLSTTAGIPQQYMAPVANFMGQSLTPFKCLSTFSRTATPVHTFTTSNSQLNHMFGQAAPVGVAVSAAPNIGLLQLQQSQHIPQHVPLSSLVANQSNLQAHAMLAAPGSNIVHTQNALIQNPNVVNVNVAHVLPSHIPQLQGTILQTPSGKIFIQPAPNNQQITLSNFGHMAANQQTHVAKGVGLGQSAILTQRPQNGVDINGGTVIQQQQQQQYDLINMPGSQQQILVPRLQPVTEMSSMAAAASNPSIMPAAHPPVFLQPANKQLQQQIPILPQSAQAIPLQQLLGGHVGQQLHVVNQCHPVNVAAATGASLASSAANANIVLQPVMPGIPPNNNNQTCFLSHQLPVEAGGKPGTLTLNLAGHNITLQQLQNSQGIQLAPAQQHQIVLQRQQQPTTTTILNVQNVHRIPLTSGCSKRLKSKSMAPTSAAASSLRSNYLVPDNILSAAIMSSGIFEDMSSKTTDSDNSERSTPKSLVETPTPSSASLLQPNVKKKRKKDAKTALGGAKSSLAKVSSSVSTIVCSTLPQTMSASDHANIARNCSCTPSATTPVLSTVPLSSFVASSSVPQQIGLPQVATTLALGLTPFKLRRGGSNIAQLLPRLECLSPQEKNELREIQVQMAAIKLRGILGQSDLTLLQQLDMRRVKILSSKLSTHTLQPRHGQWGADQQREASLQDQIVSTFPPAGPETRVSTGTSLDGETLMPVTKIEAGPLHSCRALAGFSSQTMPSAVSSDNTPSNYQPMSLKLDTKSSFVGMSPASLPVFLHSTDKLRLSHKVERPNTADCQDIKPPMQTMLSPLPVTLSTLDVTAQQLTTAGAVMAFRKANVASVPTATVGQPRLLRIQVASQPSPVPLTLFAKPTAVLSLDGASTTAGSTVPMTSPRVIAASLATSKSVSYVSTDDRPRPVKIQIAGEVKTLQLTRAQQEKLQLHLSRMTRQQQEAFLHTQRHILAKLQHRFDQDESLVKSPAANQIASSDAACKVRSGVKMLPSVVTTYGNQADGKNSSLQSVSSTCVLPSSSTLRHFFSSGRDSITVTMSGSPLTGQSSVTSEPSVALTDCPQAVAAQSSSAASVMIRSQLSKDQQHAVSPDVSSSFKDHREACRRLLRYHVFQTYGPPQDALHNFDIDNVKTCEDLIARKNSMMAKFQKLLFVESMRSFATSEEVLLGRMWSNEMQHLMREERNQVATDPDSFVPMPLEIATRDLTCDDAHESEDEVCDSDIKEEGERDQDWEANECASDVCEDHSKSCMHHHSGCRSELDSKGPSSSRKIIVSGGFCSLTPKDNGVEDSQHNSPSACNNKDSSVIDSPNISHETSPLHEGSLLHKTSPLHDAHETSPSKIKEKQLLCQSFVSAKSELVSNVNSVNRGRSSFYAEAIMQNHSLVKLVIRNDGKGFTSNLVERSSSSGRPVQCNAVLNCLHKSDSQKQGERRRGVVRDDSKRTGKAQCDDVGDRKGSVSVSITDDRVPDGLPADSEQCSPSRTGVSDSCRHPIAAYNNHGPEAMFSSTNVQRHRAVRCPASDSVGGLRSGEDAVVGKRRRPVVSGAGDVQGVSGKKLCHGSSVGCGGSDEQACCFAADNSASKARQMSPVYVGSSMESLENFDSDDDCCTHSAVVRSGFGSDCEGTPVSSDDPPSLHNPMHDAVTCRSLEVSASFRNHKLNWLQRVGDGVLDPNHIPCERNLHRSTAQATGGHTLTTFVPQSPAYGDGALRKHPPRELPRTPCIAGHLDGGQCALFGRGSQSALGEGVALGNSVVFPTHSDRKGAMDGVDSCESVTGTVLL